MANTKVTGDVIANGTISTVHIADDAITAAKLDSTATGITFADLTVSATTATLNLSGSNTGASLINFGDSDDGNVGRIYYDHTDNFMQFKTNDSEKLRIDSSGNVGIGIDNPAAKLEVKGTGTGQFIQSDVSASFDADGLTKHTRFRISSSNTASSNGILEIRSRKSDSQWRSNAIANLNGEMTFLISSTNNAEPTSSDEKMRIDSSGVVSITNSNNGINAYVENDTHNAIFQIKASATSKNSILWFGDSTNDQIGQIDYDHGDNSMRFLTAAGEKMRIDSSGNVGIGTTSPDRILHVESDSVAAIQLENTTEADSFIDFKNPSRTFRVGYDDSADLFKVAVTNFNSNAFVVNSSGNVGIGTTSPSNKLEVDGNIAVKTTSGNSGIKIITNNTSEAFLIMGDPDDNSMGGLAYNNNTNTLSIDCNNAERITIDSSGNVGIGCSPSYPLEVQSGGVGTVLRAGTSFISIDPTGSAAAPSLIFNGDSNTGIYRPTTDTLGFSTAGSERMRIDSSGNVNIYGTDNRPLAITSFNTVSTGAGWDLDATSSNGVITMSTGGTERMRIDSSGNIFATNSSGNLVLGNAASGDIYLGGGNSNTSNIILQTGSSERMRITSGGEVLIGRTNDYGSLGFKFQVDFSGLTTGILVTSDATASKTALTMRDKNTSAVAGTITFDGSSAQYNTSSDYRLKENVVEMTGALDRVSQLKPSRFNFIADADTTVDGFLAHEVQDIVPEAISGEKDAVDEEGNPEYQGIDQSKLVPLLVGAIKELKADNDNLRARIEILENQ